MAFEIARSSALPIGVDLGTSSVKMAQLRAAGGDLELIAAGLIEVPKDCRGDLRRRVGVLTKGIRGAMKSAPFKGRRCVLSVPAEDTLVQHVRIARVPPNQIADALRTELQGKLPYPVEDAVVRHLVAGEVYGEGDPKQEVIVISAPRKVLRSYLAMAQHAKLDVVGINVEPCAIVQCFSRLFRRNEDAERTTLFLDLGSTSTQVVLARGPRVVFARNLPTGGDELDRAVAEKLSISQDEAQTLRRELLKQAKDPKAEEELYRFLRGPLDAMADELTQCLRYYESVFRDQAIDRAVFLGGQAHDQRLCQALAQRLNLPSQVGDPLIRVRRGAGAGLNTGLDQRQPQPNWAVAVGLSLGAGKAA